MIGVTDTAAALADDVMGKLAVASASVLAILSVLATVIARLRDALDRVRSEARLLRESVESIATGVEAGKGDLARVLSDFDVPCAGEVAAKAHDAICARVAATTSATGVESVVNPLVREAKAKLGAGES